MPDYERITNRTVIEKINSDETDAHRDGARGVVIDWIGPISEEQAAAMGKPEDGGMYCYCIHWDDMPGVPVWITGRRIRKIRTSDPQT